MSELINKDVKEIECMRCGNLSTHRVDIRDYIDFLCDRCCLSGRYFWKTNHYSFGNNEKNYER